MNLPYKLAAKKAELGMARLRLLAGLAGERAVTLRHETLLGMAEAYRAMGRAVDRPMQPADSAGECRAAATVLERLAMVERGIIMPRIPAGEAELWLAVAQCHSPELRARALRELAGLAVTRYGPSAAFILSELAGIQAAAAKRSARS